MATAYSDEVAIGSYNRIRLRVEYSGTSATCYIEFRRTSAWTATWSDDAASISFNGTTKSAPYNYYGYVDGSWRTIDSASGFTVPTAGGTLSWSFNNPTPGSVLGCSGSIVIPSQGTPPSGGYIDNVTTYWDSTNNEIRVHTDAAGVTSTGSSSLTNLSWNITEVPYVTGVARRSVEITNGASATLSNSLSTYTGTTIDIAPNKMLYTGLYAANSSGAYRYNGGTLVTVAAPASVTQGATTQTSISINYSTSADGGYHDKVLQYSLDGGTTWITGVTITTGDPTVGIFTINGLSQHTEYVVLTRMSTEVGHTDGPTLTVSTSDIPAKLYGSVNDQTTKIKKLYCSVNGQTRRVKRLYASVNGAAKVIFGG